MQAYPFPNFGVSSSFGSLDSRGHSSHNLFYELTLNGHVENLIQGQGHYLIGKGHAAYQSIRNCRPMETHLRCFNHTVAPAY